MSHPQIVWLKPGTKQQAQYICFLAKTITRGEFSRGGFWVLPYCPSGVPYTVYFPDFDYSKQYWKEIRKTSNLDLCKHFPDEAIEEVSKLLETKQTSASSLKSQWQEINDRFFEYCSEFLILDEMLQKLERIEITVSPYGTGGSYDFWKGTSGDILYIVIRDDMNLHKLVQVMLMAFWTKQTRQRAEIQEYKWLNKMATVEFLMKNTVFSTLARDASQPHSQDIETYSRESRAYLEKLGSTLT